jgi:hypothetical protein
MGKDNGKITPMKVAVPDKAVVQMLWALKLYKVTASFLHVRHTLQPHIRFNVVPIFKVHFLVFFYHFDIASIFPAALTSLQLLHKFPHTLFPPWNEICPFIGLVHYCSAPKQ